MKMQNLSKIFVLILFSLMFVCNICFADNWFSCNSIWQFDLDSIRSLNSSYVQLQVDLKCCPGDGSTTLVRAVLTPNGPKPYHFKVINSSLIMPDGKIYYNAKIHSFEDFDLANAICNLANVR